jgi:FkbM family methyltransferase
MDLRAVNPEVEDQSAELALISGLIPELDDRSAIDVGSLSGAVAAVLRDAGAAPMWLIEPFPPSAERLRERFAADPGVEVLETAAGAEDGTAELHLARDPAGAALEAFHTVQPRSPSAEVAWDGSVSVQVRSLDSLSAAGEIPHHVGVLKIDAEGSDAEVLRGARSLTADVVMVEFWADLPRWVGRCPFDLRELRGLVEALGPRRFLFVRHGPRHVGIGRWDSAEVAEGEWGNLVFVSDPHVDAVEALLPKLDRALLERSERLTAEQEAAATERLELIHELEQIADERQRVIEQGVAARLSARLRRDRRSARAASQPLDPLDDVE